MEVGSWELEVGREKKEKREEKRENTGFQIRLHDYTNQRLNEVQILRSYLPLNDKAVESRKSEVGSGKSEVGSRKLN